MHAIERAWHIARSFPRQRAEPTGPRIPAAGRRSAAAGAEGRDAERRDAAGPSVLVVSADPDTRHIFQLTLEWAGYRVRVVDDPGRAADSASGCALVITNYPTRDVTGRTVTERLRADPRTAGVKILNATTHVMAEELALAEAAGVSATLLLPANPLTVLAAVESLIGAPDGA